MGRESAQKAAPDVLSAAFSTVVKSLVTDIIMPPTGLLLGGVDFADLFVVLREGSEAAAPYATLQQAQAAGAVTLNYGLFLNPHQPSPLGRREGQALGLEFLRGNPSSTNLSDPATALCFDHRERRVRREER